jgi:hypothetical protein
LGPKAKADDSPSVSHRLTSSVRSQWAARVSLDIDRQLQAAPPLRTKHPRQVDIQQRDVDLRGVGRKRIFY